MWDQIDAGILRHTSGITEVAQRIKNRDIIVKFKNRLSRYDALFAIKVHLKEKTAKGLGLVMKVVCL